MRAIVQAKRIATLAGIFLFFLAARANAATFEDYRARVFQATTAIQQLEAPGYYSDDPVPRLRQLLPASEIVFTNGQNIDVDNKWFHEALDEYEKISGQRDRASALIARTREQLRALLQRLDEMKAATSVSDKDVSKARLAEILRRDEYGKSAAKPSMLAQLWDRFMNWLSKLFPKFKPISPGAGRSISAIAQVVVIALCIALIAFLIWKFLPGFLRARVGKSKKKKKSEPRIVLGEKLDPDQTAADLLEQAEALARAGDLRAAVRKAYIALLCELGDRKVISLAQHKTNRDYLMSVRNRRSIYEPLRKLTGSFELHWYGFVPPQATDWEEFRLGCRRAVTTNE